MPTGYTADVGDGKCTDFPEFAMQCARNFGALITLRDSPGEPIPDEFVPSTYGQNRLAEARQRLAFLNEFTPEDAAHNARTHHASELVRWTVRQKERTEKQARYEAMLAHVQAWEPPTPDHVEMKTFMAEQLTGSIYFDCSNTYDVEPVAQTGPEWLAAEIARAQWDCDYHAKQQREEEERSRGRTEWVRALRRSLDGGMVKQS